MRVEGSRIAGSKRGPGRIRNPGLTHTQHRARRLLLSVIGAVWLAAGPAAPCLAADEAVWKQADAPRVWRFPRDHGAHPSYRTEWWYFTGNLRDGDGNRYGYQLAFFRQGIRPVPSDPRNPWSIRDLYLAHFAITDVSAGRFITDERVSRTGPGLAGARTDELSVRLLDWSAKGVGNRIVLKAKSTEVGLCLDLTPLKTVVTHGENGLSRKGDQAGQASYYVSCTDVRTAGWLKKTGASIAATVRGVSWFDHEFGSNQLTADQSGWDWFSLHLTDGTELMLYLLRRVDGSVEPASSGTLVEKTGVSRHIALSQIKVEVLDHWKSNKSGGLYPSRWRIRIPPEGVELIVSPLLSNQELLTPGSTGITYWEGAVDGRGTSRGRSITCEGYVELTGYAGKLGGIL
jgi:predicted secreted hydrolase